IRSPKSQQQQQQQPHQARSSLSAFVFHTFSFDDIVNEAGIAEAIRVSKGPSGSVYRAEYNGGPCAGRLDHRHWSGCWLWDAGLPAGAGAGTHGRPAPVVQQKRIRDRGLQHRLMHQVTQAWRSCTDIIYRDFELLDNVLVFSLSTERTVVYGLSADVYSLGICTYGIVTNGRHPFENSLLFETQFDEATLKPNKRPAASEFLAALCRPEFLCLRAWIQFKEATPVAFLSPDNERAPIHTFTATNRQTSLLVAKGSKLFSLSLRRDSTEPIKASSVQQQQPAESRRDFR
uniref:Protein kinase domain-containing protein n=1 Tax=Macrostomum lignano TaxID=282301 RepID=A0A1I8FDR0_9PLAT